MKAGSVGFTPKIPQTTADAGADAHGCDHERFGFSSVVHASIVAVAPWVIILHHEFLAQLVSICGGGGGSSGRRMR